MRFFQGLYLYEVVLLVLGVALFLVVLVSLSAQLKKGRSPVKMVPYFLVSIVMIGFPSIQSIKYGDWLVTLKNAVEEIQSSPSSPEARAQLSEAVEKVSRRPVATPDVAISLAKAQFALGNEHAAEQNAQKALELEPGAAEPTRVLQQIKALRKLDVLAARVKESPQDSGAESQLREQLATVQSAPLANPETLTKVARAQDALGARNQARATLDTALKINPSATSAIQLQRQIGR